MYDFHKRLNEILTDVWDLLSEADDVSSISITADVTGRGAHVVGSADFLEGEHYSQSLYMDLGSGFDDEGKSVK